MPDQTIEWARRAVAAMPFAAALGIEVTAVDAREVRARMAWTPEHCTSGGILHGGALITFADTLGAICAGLNVPPGSRSSTLEAKANFLRPVAGGHVAAVARAVHVGRSTVVVQTDLFDDEGRRVALVTQTQAVRPLER